MARGRSGWIVVALCFIAGACDTPGPAPWSTPVPRVARCRAAPAPCIDYDPPAPAPSCQAELRIAAALPDPAEVPDSEGEWVWLRHASPEPVDLSDWSLRSRSRIGWLAGGLAGGGDLVLWGPDLGTLRLSNGGATLVLVDPCGVEVSRLSWGRVDPEEVIVGAAPWEPQSPTEGSKPNPPWDVCLPGGGCGQT